jgi:hypothetical protein
MGVRTRHITNNSSHKQFQTLCLEISVAVDS